MDIEIWAHRGRITSELPGNNLADFQKSYDMGIYRIETDVCFTVPDKDNLQQPIIHHPNRNSDGRSKVEILSLDSFLDFLNIHPNFLCCLELKENSDKLMSIVVRKITDCGLENRVYLTACQIRIPFLDLEASAKLLEKARVQNHKIKTHLIATFPFSLPTLAWRYYPNIISVGWLPESRLSTWFFKTFLIKTTNLKYQIRQVQNMGIKVIGGIVNSREDFEYLANLGVDGIMTDNPLAVMKFVKSKSP